MGLDILAGLCLLGGAAFGAPSGTAHQLIRLAAVVVAGLGALLGLVPIAGFFYRMSGAGFETAVGASYLASFSVWLLLLWLATEELSNRVRDGQLRSTNDGYGGAIVGAVRGVALAYILAIGLVTLKPSLASQGYDGEAGWLGQVALENNALSEPLTKLVDRELAREDQAHEKSWDRAVR